VDCLTLLISHKTGTALNSTSSVNPETSVNDDHLLANQKINVRTTLISSPVVIGK
jgi:hypothetical protein